MSKASGKHNALRVEDDLTAVNAVRIRDLFVDALAGEGPLVLDLSTVGEMDSAGFQLLAALRRGAAEAGREFGITAHSPATLAVMKLYNMKEYFGLDADALGILGDAGDEEEPESDEDGQQ